MEFTKQNIEQIRSNTTSELTKDVTCVGNYG